MSTVRRIAKNTGVLLISRVTSYAMGFLFIVCTARYLGAEGFGVLSFALAFTVIFGVFADLGLRQLTVREVARNESLARKYLGNVAVMKVILVILTFGLIALTINLLGYPELTIKVVYLIALSVIFNSFNNMFYSIFQAYEKMEYQSLAQILNSALMLASALFAISQGFGIIGFALIYSIVTAIVLLYNFIICMWKFIRPKLEIDWVFWKDTIKKALPFGLTGIFVTMYHYVDSVMISYMVGNTEVGLYNAAYRIAFTFSLISEVYFTALFPNMSRWYIKEKETLKQAFNISFKLMLYTGLIVGIMITFFSDYIIRVIFGREFLSSISLLKILIWSISLSFVNTSLAIMLDVTNNQHLNSLRVFIGVLFNIVLNLFLIPRYGALGAAVATLVTRIFIMVLVLLLLKYMNIISEFPNPILTKNDLKVLHRGWKEVQ